MARPYVHSVDEVRGGELIRVVGEVRALPSAPSFAAPLTGRPCLYYEAEVAVEYTRVTAGEKIGKRRTRERRVLARHRAGVDLLVQGRTTSARVVLTERTMLRVVTERWNVPEGAVPPEVARFRAQHHVAEPPPSWGSARDLQCVEALIQEGEKVLVAGAASWEPDPSAGYRGGRRLVLYAAPDHQLIVTDEPSQTGG